MNVISSADRLDHHHSKAIPIWLFTCAAFVFVMVIVGAITRLTGSGLSMVEWRPLIGALPPLNETEWNRVFALYQKSPQFIYETYWMELHDFKVIFFWEWFHRLLGRFIGLVYAVPLAWFWIRGKIPAGYKLKLFGLLILGGLQGLMGWYMVKSGLSDVPAVSHYRLAAHLGLAFLLFSVLVWLGLSLSKVKPQPCKSLFTHGWIVLGSLVITIFWGAYVAGLDAGLIYNDTFPKMGDRWIPREILSAKPYQPVWLNLFEDHVGVQFMHRWLAMFTVLMILGFWAHAAYKKHTPLALNSLAVMALLQMGLGIATLLSGISLPLAVMHQTGALVTLMLLVITLWTLRPHTLAA